MTIRTLVQTASAMGLLLVSTAAARADSGQVHYWQLTNGQRINGIDIFSPAGPDWTLRGVGDVDGDGTDDIVWQNRSGQVSYWKMSNGRRVNSVNISTPVGTDWSLRGVGDVDGDGTDDIVWQNRSGQVHYWHMRNGLRTGGIDIDTPVGSEWRLRGVGDVNGDGTDDIVWEQNAGRVHYWRMSNGTRSDGIDVPLPAGAQWSLRGAGDVNGDGTDDIVLQNSTGQVMYWRMSADQRAAGFNIDSPVGAEWSLRGVGDVNGDGTDDLVWQSRDLFAASMTAANAHAMIGRLGSASQGFVDGPRSEEQHAAGNHINGMARVGPYWVVNYTDAGRESGRILYWNGRPGDSYSVHRVAGVGGGDNYLAGMDGAADILAFKIKGSSLRFLRLTPSGSPVELPSNADVSYTRVGFAFDDDRQTFVLATKNDLANFDIREGSPGNWVLLGTLAYSGSWGDQESAPLVYMGNGIFAAFVLGPKDDPFQFTYQVFTLGGTGLKRTVTSFGSPTTVTLQHSEPAAWGIDPSHGYPNFRWAGTVRFNGTDLEICASPRELNNMYNGAYSCWSAR